MPAMLSIYLAPRTSPGDRFEDLSSTMGPNDVNGPLPGPSSPSTDRPGPQRCPARLGGPYRLLSKMFFLPSATKTLQRWYVTPKKNLTCTLWNCQCRQLSLRYFTFLRTQRRTRTDPTDSPPLQMRPLPLSLSLSPTLPIILHRIILP